MDYTAIAQSIPKEYRDEILNLNFIADAVGVASDKPMFYLHTVWKQFVEPTIGDCNLCFQRVLENFRKMQQTLVDLKKSEALLDDV